MAGVQIDGVNNKIDFDDDQDTSISANTDDTLVIEAGGNTLATFTATTLTINDGTTITTADNTDTLTLTSTDADANSGPNLRLYRNSGSPADSDVLGQIDFEGRNDNSQDYVAAQIKTATGDVSDGTEDAQIEFDVMTAGTLREYLRMASGSEPSVVINEGGQDIDFRVESDSNTHGLFVDGGNNAVLINKSSPTQNYYHLDGTIIAGFEMFGTANAAGRMSAFTYGSADTGGHLMTFGKSRSATPDDYTIVQDGDQLGRISFQGADGTHFVAAAQIHATVDGTPGANDMPGRLSFHTTNDGGTTLNERMRIHNHGQVLVGNNLVAENSQKLHVSTTGTSPGFGCDSQVTSLGSSNTVMEVSCKTSSSSGYRLFRGLSGNSSSTSFSDNEFIFLGNGNLAIDGSYTSGGADYAEMFEWKDGNASSEDRRGYSVVLDGNQIVKATESDDASKIIGIVSALPVLIGDSDIDEKWKSKYLKDDFGNFVLEEYTTTTWTEIYKNSYDVDEIKEHSYATDRIPSDVTVPSDAFVKSTHDDGTKITRKKINPDWDSSQTYVRRQDRKEWDAIGLMGKLRILKGQPTGTNWIKMRDISDSIEEWLVR